MLRLYLLLFLFRRMNSGKVTDKQGELAFLPFPCLALDRFGAIIIIMIIIVKKSRKKERKKENPFPEKLLVNVPTER